MDRAPDVTVAAVTETGGRFLVVEERIEQRLLFNQPAGHVEPGETLLSAVRREALEETAWRFHPQSLLGVYRWRNPGSGRWVLRFAFVGPVSDHDPHQALDDGIVCTHWLGCEELEAQHARLRSPLVLRCVHDYLAGQRQPLDGIGELDLGAAAGITPTATIA